MKKKKSIRVFISYQIFLQTMAASCLLIFANNIPACISLHFATMFWVVSEVYLQPAL